MSTKFPTPFAGIGFAAPAEDIVFAIEILLSCPHPHNFAVELDASPPQIYVSEAGMHCLTGLGDE